MHLRSSDVACRRGGETSQETKPPIPFRYDSIARPEFTDFRTPKKTSEYFLIKVPTLGAGVTETEKVRTNPFRTTASPSSPPSLFSSFSILGRISVKIQFVFQFSKSRFVRHFCHKTALHLFAQTTLLFFSSGTRAKHPVDDLSHPIFFFAEGCKTTHFVEPTSVRPNKQKRLDTQCIVHLQPLRNKKILIMTNIMSK